MQTLAKKPLLRAYTTSTIENLLSIINSLTKIGTGYNRKLSNLMKIYNDNIKYSGYNNSFIFKLAIFHNICFKTNVLLKRKMKVFSIILKNLALNNYF